MTPVKKINVKDWHAGALHILILIITVSFKAFYQLQRTRPKRLHSIIIPGSGFCYDSTRNCCILDSLLVQKDLTIVICQTANMNEIAPNKLLLYPLQSST